MSLNWYAIYTRSRHEQKVHDRLSKKSIETFLPMMEKWSRRKDRRKRITAPLFPGYLFVKAEMDAYTHLEILKTGSVVKILCHDDRPAVIPEEQIQSFQVLMNNGISATRCPYLKEGMKVKVVNGPLAGVEGILEKIKSNRQRLILSVDLLKESMAVEIADLDVEPVHA